MSPFLQNRNVPLIRLPKGGRIGLSDFNLPLETPQLKDSRKVAGSNFIVTAPAPSPWDRRPQADIDIVLELSGYKRDGRKYVCPTCGHGAVTVDRQKSVYHCHFCQRGNHIGALARKVGKRLI